MRTREQERQRARLRRLHSGVSTRERYLAGSLTASKPWEAEGISRRTWERRRATTTRSSEPRGPELRQESARSAEPWDAPATRGDLFGMTQVRPTGKAGRKARASRGDAPATEVVDASPSHQAPPSSPGDDWPVDYREAFWAAYPRKLDKKDAMKVLDTVRASGINFPALLAAVVRYAVWLEDAEHWRPDAKYPATWLRHGCWDDELPVGRRLERRETSNGFAELHRQLREGF